MKQKNRFYCYHAMHDWPLTIQTGVRNFIPLTKLRNKSSYKIKSLNSCLDVYKNNFCGWNIHSSVWLKNLNNLKTSYYCRVVRIGVVDI